MMSLRQFITPLFLVSYIIYFVERRFFKNEYLLIGIIILFAINTLMIVYELFNFSKFKHTYKSPQKVLGVLILQLIANSGFLILIYYSEYHAGLF